MKIIHSKYTSILSDNKIFSDKNSEYFKRSDSDYGLFINSKFNKSDYTKHYYWMNVLSFNLLNKIGEFMDNNLDDLLPINKINNDSLKNQLNKINKLLKEDRDRNNTQKQNRLTYFDGIKEFIGISIYNQTYMTEEIPSNFLIKKLKSSSLTENDTIKHDYKYIDKSEFMKQHKYIPIARNKFYITVGQEDEKYYQVLCNVNDKPLNSGIYQYYNETNYFSGQGQGIEFNYFTLHRLKLNIVLYFKTWSEKNTAYGFFICPSELIDIPVSTFDDYKKNINFSKYFQIYENTIDNKQLIFNSYTIYGIVDDICKSIFVEEEFPWNDNKFQKKIHRLVYFFLIYLNNSYSNLDEIKNKLDEYFNNGYDLNKAELNFKTYSGTDIISSKEPLYNKILGFISDVNERVKTSGNKEYENKMNDI